MNTARHFMNKDIVLLLIGILIFPSSPVAAPTVTGDCLAGDTVTLSSGSYASGEGVNCAASNGLVVEDLIMSSGAEVNLSSASVQLLPSSTLTPTFRANTAIADPSGDLDGDGMTNAFETRYGLAPGDASDATADKDGDGVTNLQESRDGTDPTDANDYSGSLYPVPLALSETLDQTRSVSWAALSTAPTARSRFAMGEAGESSLFLVADNDTSVSDSLAVDNSLASETSVTTDRLLRSIFQLIEESSGIYRIVPSKHFNYAIDVDSTTTNNLILRDIRSSFLDANSAGYLLFTLNSETDGYRLMATQRKVYNSTSSTFEDDASWASRSLTVVGGALTASSGSYTPLTLYEPPLDLEIPFDFNPDQTARVDNSEVTPEAKGDDPLSGLAAKVVSAYSAQVTAKGLDESTTAAAGTMLDTIASDLSAEGAAMRYASELYLAFRASLLARTSGSSDSMDMPLGESTVPYVYFTNETDGEGVHHPFMVIASYGVPEGMALLWDVTRPPGDGIAEGYTNQSVTRSYHYEALMVKIPLRDYGEVSSLTDNTMVNDLASDVGHSPFDHHNYASIAANGVAIDGIIIYPSYNNALHFAQSDAELSARGMHAGRGLGVHYHADSHSATHSGLNLYNDTDYEGKSHPPLVSFGFDGVAGYGVYAADDTTSDGVQVALDDFGGHEHDSYGYHYHAYTKSATTNASVDYTVHTLPPQGAWAGVINDIPEFWDGTAPGYVNGNSVYLGTQ